MDYTPNHNNDAYFLPNTQIAVLESRVDHLETELSYLNQLLIRCGFSDGIATLKFTAEELIKETYPTSYE